MTVYLSIFFFYLSSLYATIHGMVVHNGQFNQQHGVHGTTAARAVDGKKDEPNSYESIQELYAYDPIDQLWRQIKHFAVIKVYLNTQKEQKILDLAPYTDLWAYDGTTQQWHKVNLIPYLQQLGIQSTDSSSTPKKQVMPDDHTTIQEQSTMELLEVFPDPVKYNNPQDHRDSLWSRLSLGCSIGGGMTFYKNSLINLCLLQRDQSNYFLVTKAGEVYKPNWFYGTLTKISNFQYFHVQGSRSYAVDFTAKGFLIPITLALQYDFQSCPLFIGIGREMVLSYIATWRHHDHMIPNKTLQVNRWMVQGRWLAKIGWYIIRNEKHRFFLDMRLCYVHHLGSCFRKVITFGSYLHQALAYNLGGGYERQFTDRFLYTTRLAVEWQSFKQFPACSSNIAYKQLSLYLQIGLSMQCASASSSNVRMCKPLYSTKTNNKRSIHPMH